MAYNHAKEELIFANHWAKLRDEYVQAGMSEDAIQAISPDDMRKHEPLGMVRHDHCYTCERFNQP